MGNAFGCTAGERPDKDSSIQAKNGGKAVGIDDDYLTILLQDEEDFSVAHGHVTGSSVIAFQGRLELAFRCSITVVLLSLPLIVPGWHKDLSAIPGLPAWLGMIPGGVCLMTVFTVYENLGLTVQLAWQGGIGTAIACLWSHVMGAIMPQGAYGKHYDPYIMNACNVGLVLFTYFFNLSKNARAFIISYHVFFVMALQNPAADPGLNTTWAIDFEASNATTLFTALLGLAGAVCVMLFPTPIMAKKIANATSKTAARKLCDIVDALNEYYKRKDPSVAIAKLETDAIGLQSTVNSMIANIDGSWWEHFDLGIQGKIRRNLTGQAKLLQMCTDNVFAMQIAIAREDFGKSHVDCMDKINGKVSDLLTASTTLLLKATDSAGDGSIDDTERAELEEANGTVETAITELAKVYNTTRKKMFPERVINQELQAESFFVYCLSIHARRILEYSKGLLDTNPEVVPLKTEMINAVKGMKPDFKGLNKSSFAVRGSLEVLLSYYMGLYLFNYNASAACTVSLLLAEFTGSALIKNLGRLQAVVLSAVVPHIITGMIGSSCDPAIACLKGVAIFAWLMLTLYTYYSSPTYGYIGCLCAAFALGTLIYPCQHLTGAEAAAADDAYSFMQYTKILQTTIAVIIMMVVDSILSGGRASDLASQSLVRGLIHIDVWFQAAFTTRDSTGDAINEFTSREDILKDKEFAKEVASIKAQDRKRGTIMALLSSAASLGAEADKEPRYHRIAWPSSFFSTVVHQGQILRANLNLVEQVLMGANSDSLYDDVFSKIRSSQAWNSVRNDVVNTLGEAMYMVQEVLHNETDKPLPDMIERAKKLEGAETLDDMPSLIKVINQSGLKYPAEGTKITSLEEDNICRINVVLMLMDASVGNIADIVKACLQQLK